MDKNQKFTTNPKTGAVWEAKSSLEKFFKNLTSYQVCNWNEIDQKGLNAFKLYYENNPQPVAFIFKNNAIYKFLKDQYGVEYRSLVSKKLLPDNSIFVVSNNTFFIIEHKSQKRSGSVDEKLQTCDFKKKQWEKILSVMNCKIEYVYVLDKWFKRPEYKDVLGYIESVGCSYYFHYIPLVKFGLPKNNESPFFE